MYNWGLLAYEGVVGKVGSALSFFIGVPQAESIPLFLGWGFAAFFGMGVLQQFWDRVFFAAFWDGVLQRPASKFYQGLESNSYGHYRVFGGDQSLGACNSRVD